MDCPKCGSNQVTVVDTRRKDEAIKRRRCCLVCGNRYNTAEISEERLKKLERDAAAAEEFRNMTADWQRRYAIE